MIRIEIVFKMRIVYKSGYVHDFEVTSFEYVNNRYKWTPASHRNKPVDLGATEVAAVWQLSHRKRLRFGRG